MSLLPAEILSSLTPWAGVVTGAEVGPRAPCSANVSHVRDLLLDLLVGGGRLETLGRT